MTIINDPNRKVILEEYNSEWKIRFEDEFKILQKVLVDFNPHIEHVGSTSVPGMVSKPIVDIMVGLQDLSIAKEVIEILEKKLLYHYDQTKEKVVPNRRHLWKGNQEIHLFHLWIVGIESKDWKDMIYVREYLKHNENARNKYGNFKRNLIRNEINSISEYIKRKQIIYDEILAEAWNYAKTTK